MKKGEKKKKKKPLKKLGNYFSFIICFSLLKLMIMISRKIVAEQQSSRLDEVKASSNTDDSSSPSQDRGAEGRERQRLREQERRRREAVSYFY